MTSASYRQRTGWGARLLVAFALILVGAAAAAWALARYDQAARFLGVTPEPKVVVRQVPVSPRKPAVTAADQPASAKSERRVSELETRLARVEGSTQRVEGSAGRADALLVAFAARRAIERGVPLGYLEPLLLGRFGHSNPKAVATIVSFSQSPVRLHELISRYEELGPTLRSGGADAGWWSEFQRELRSLISVRHADRPSGKPDARYRRALEMLSSGDVDSALAETMRLPGASKAGDWIGRARRYVAVRRALDEIESAALMGSPAQN